MGFDLQSAGVYRIQNFSLLTFCRLYLPRDSDPHQLFKLAVLLLPESLSAYLVHSRPISLPLSEKDCMLADSRLAVHRHRLFVIPNTANINANAACSFVNRDSSMVIIFLKA
ncbi:hypothetical protein V22_24200 [Calycomorphotria hydatis]|uniref:Uncharacterized protein n=1 Tax=Calycomorphotria hydatis TaxID=2528027 RepID=A0A517T9Y3_9PLAN|nr:hypothetical protein V22_24200 [Calycomorphotria hydatis]